MKQFTQRYAAVLFVIVLTGSLTGCGALDPEPLKTYREIPRAFNDMADTLETVRDAESARAAAPDIEAGYARLVRLIERVPILYQKYKDTRINNQTLAQIDQDLDQAGPRVIMEMKRLNQTRGLPAEFWNVTRRGSADLLVVSIRCKPFGQEPAAKEATDYAYNSQALLNKHGCGKVVGVDMTNLPSNLAQQACDRIGDAAPGATLYHLSAGKTHSVMLGPVDDFQTIVDAIDFGTITYQDKARMSLIVEVDRRKLGARFNSDEEEWQLREKERQLRKEESRQFSEKIRKDLDAARDQSEAEWARLKKERREPDPNDSDYYEQLAERVTSGHHFDRNKAINVLLNTRPEQVKSAETRKRIARAFKDMALEKGFNQEPAIRGLVIWGGKYSVPVLIDMLADRSTLFHRAAIFRALAELQDERAAAPVAAHLGDLVNHDAACTCLRRLGPLAEDALIDLAPSNNPSISLSAVQLLGEVGTGKCLELLKQAARSRNTHVKTAAKRSIEKILDRQGKEKEEAEQKQE